VAGPEVVEPGFAAFAAVGLVLVANATVFVVRLPILPVLTVLPLYAVFVTVLPLLLIDCMVTELRAATEFIEAVLADAPAVDMAVGVVIGGIGFVVETTVVGGVVVGAIVVGVVVVGIVVVIVVTGVVVGTVVVIGKHNRAVVSK